MLVSACGGEENDRPARKAATVETVAKQPPPLPDRPASGGSKGEDERSAAPQDAGGQAAADVARTYYALIEAGDYAQAWRYRWESDTAPPAAAAAFVDAIGQYREYHATVGAPSQVAGAAGSLYVEVPVQIYGTLKTGKPFGTAGTITLRRVNDVPGATPQQRRWRIYSR